MRRWLVGLALLLALGVAAWQILDPGPRPPGWYATFEGYWQRPGCRERMTLHGLLTLAPDIEPGLGDRIQRIEVSSDALAQTVVAEVSDDRSSVIYPGLFSSGRHTESYRIACDANGCRLTFLAYVTEYEPVASTGDFEMRLLDADGQLLKSVDFAALPIPEPQSDPAVMQRLEVLLERLASVDRGGGSLGYDLAQPEDASRTGVILQGREAGGPFREAAVETTGGQGDRKAFLPLSSQPAYQAALIWHQPTGQNRRYEAKVEWINSDDPFMRCE